MPVDEEALRLRLGEELSASPAKGYRLLHRELQSDARFAGVGLKRIQALVQEIKAAAEAPHTKAIVRGAAKAQDTESQGREDVLFQKALQRAKSCSAEGGDMVSKLRVVMEHHSAGSTNGLSDGMLLNVVRTSFIAFPEFKDLELDLPNDELLLPFLLEIGTQRVAEVLRESGRPTNDSAKEAIAWNILVDAVMEQAKERSLPLASPPSPLVQESRSQQYHVASLLPGQVVYALFDSPGDRGVRFGDRGTVVEWPCSARYDVHRYVAAEFRYDLVPVLFEHVSLSKPDTLDKLFPKGCVVYYTKHDDDTAVGEPGVVVGWGLSALERRRSVGMETAKHVRVKFRAGEWALPAGRLTLHPPPRTVAGGLELSQTVYMIGQDEDIDFGEEGQVWAHAYEMGCVCVTWTSGNQSIKYSFELSPARPDAQERRKILEKVCVEFLLVFESALECVEERPDDVYKAFDVIQAKIRGMWSSRLLDRLKSGSDLSQTVSELTILSDVAALTLQRLLQILSRSPDLGAPFLQQKLIISGCSNRDYTEAKDDEVGEHTAIPSTVEIHSCLSLRQWLEMQTRIEMVTVSCRRVQWEAMALGFDPARDKVCRAFDEARSIAEEFGDLEAVIEVVRAFARMSDRGRAGGMVGMSSTVEAGAALRTADGGYAGRRYVKSTLTIMSERLRKLWVVLKQSKTSSPPLQKAALRSLEDATWAKYEQLCGDISSAALRAHKSVDRARYALKMFDALKTCLDSPSAWLRDWYQCQRHIVLVLRKEVGLCLHDVLDASELEIVRQREWREATAEQVTEACNRWMAEALERIKNGREIGELLRSTNLMGTSGSLEHGISRTGDLLAVSVKSIKSELKCLKASSLTAQRDFLERKRVEKAAVINFLPKNVVDQAEVARKEFTLASCAFCSVFEEKKGHFLKCSACREAAYCCVEHQKRHWKVHKKTCSKQRVEKQCEVGGLSQVQPLADTSCTTTDELGGLQEVTLDVAPNETRLVSEAPSRRQLVEEPTPLPPVGDNEHDVQPAAQGFFEKIMGLFWTDQ
eukprot:CAMPEP_0117588714 /NCGR_PEP_ID=MMETSP0784-20121206/70004_1 /TAXON_ID=39447 /ORGANISM="" /LENGTH=1038 /DNA_ID=CAMNT_0005390103 /DNA_START=32 /DNA_END=3148 /DNA_ORIENTATION=+